MKGITLWQPWASAMAAGLKRNETRGHLTLYRGDLVICSAKRKVKDDLSFDCEQQLWRSRDKFKGYAGNVGDVIANMPLGFALCVVEVYDCWPTERFKTTGIIRADEIIFGNYDPCRYAWLTRNLRVLKEPVAVTGKQGFFNLPPDVEAKVRAQM